MSFRRDYRPLVTLSERFYRRLLFFYPRSFRQEYGRAMSVLFRDQCKDALGGDGLVGLVKLWLRVVVDMAMTACREHLSQLQNTMSEFLMKTIFRKPTLTFAKVFTATFLLLTAVLIIAVVFWLPRVYLSTARVAVERQHAPSGEPYEGYDPFFIQTEFEKIKSKDVLNAVIEELGLTRWLAQQTGASARLTLSDSYQLLKPMVDIRQMRNTSMLEVRVFSEDRGDGGQDCQQNRGCLSSEV